MTLTRLSTPNISETDIAAVAEVLRSGNLVYGQVGRNFEAALASFLDIEEVVVVSSGTAALFLALRGLEIGPGDAVLVPDFTFPATANAVAMAGARPVRVDVDAATYCITPSAVDAAIASYTGAERLVALMVVHEFGTPCDMIAFRELADRHGLFLVEDAACALGARTDTGMIGTGSDAACFSFHPRKTLTTGEGGAIVTSNRALADRLRVMRNHGITFENGAASFAEPALNFRLTDVQSALGLSQLPRLADWIDTRRTLAQHYLKQLASLQDQGVLTVPKQVDGQSWQTFMIVLHDRFDRSAVIAALREKGFETNMGAQCLGDTPAYASGSADHHMSVAHRLAIQGLALPLCELMTTQDIDRVVGALRECLDAFS